MKLKRKSKTLWFNWLTVAMTVAGIILQYVDVIGLDQTTAGRIGFATALFVAVANIGLRLVTTQAVGSGADT